MKHTWKYDDSMMILVIKDDFELPSVMILVAKF